MKRALLTPLAALAALGTGALGAGANAQSAAGHGSALFISPMGEPFRGQSGEEQLRAWFARADSNHDGALSMAEMKADAERFFAVLNANGDGEIDPAELRVYEEQIAPEIRVGVGSMEITNGFAPKRRSGLSADYSKTGSVEPPLERDVVRRGAGQYSMLDTPNPVASADANLNRGISLEEFDRAARERFTMLDANRDGSIRFDELPPLPSRHQRHR